MNKFRKRIVLCYRTNNFWCKIYRNICSAQISHPDFVSPWTVLIVIIYDTKRHADSLQLTRKCAKLLRQLLPGCSPEILKKKFPERRASLRDCRRVFSIRHYARPSPRYARQVRLFHVLPFFLPRFYAFRNNELCLRVEFRVFFLCAVHASSLISFLLARR